MHKIVSLIGILLVPFLSLAQKVWTPVSQDISFKIKNAGMTVHGSFDGWRTELLFGTDHLSDSKLKATIQVNSIKTGIGLRDKHLKEESYFNADSFKTIEVVSSKLYIKGVNYAGLFNVTIKGVTKAVEIPFEFLQFADEATLRGSFIINRRDFGVGGKSFTMGDEVTISIEIKAKMVK